MAGSADQAGGALPAPRPPRGKKQQAVEIWWLASWGGFAPTVKKTVGAERDA